VSADPDKQNEKESVDRHAAFIGDLFGRVLSKTRRAFAMAVGPEFAGTTPCTFLKLENGSQGFQLPE
jgi:hypothetical protein